MSFRGESSIAGDVCYNEGSEIQLLYLQKLHGVQQGQQVRRHHSHPAADKVIVSLA